MMTSRRFGLLAAVAALALVGAVLLANQRVSSTRETSELLYPELKAQADSVKALRIYKAGDARALEIVRNGADWTLTERNDYPVAADKVRKLVQALADAKVVEEKTSDATKYAAIGVEDLQATDAKSVRIELEGPARPVSLIVGKEAPGGKSSYVRRAGETQSWQINQPLSVSPEAGDWLDKDILNVSAERIQAAAIEIAGQKAYSAAKASRADPDFKVEPLPKGKELNSPSTANSAASALMNLTLDDVQPKAQLSAEKPAAQASYKTFDGLVVQLEGYKQDDKHFVTIAPSYDAALAEQFKLKTADDKAKADAPAAATSNNVEEEAKQAAAKLQNWAYEIAGYKYDTIFRPLDEMLKK